MKKLFVPEPDFQLTSWLFIKLLALIYFAAFLSLYSQITGLVGSDGILPFADLLDRAEQQLGSTAWWYLPNVFWINSSDLALQAATLLGCFFSILVLIGRSPRLSLLALFVLYLSLYHAGQIFLNFQWDYLLLETGFLSLFLLNGPNRLLILLFHWLLFRLRFLSGLSKLLSGDPSWAGLATLNSYFETQPLPHAGAWYAHQLPGWLLQSGTALVLFIELVVPFFIFLPRRFRLVAAFLTILIQLLIIATSNHNYINLLTILLCLFLLDDRIVRKLVPVFLQPRSLRDSGGSSGTGDQAPGVLSRLSLGVAATVIFTVSLASIYTMISRNPLPATLQPLAYIAHGFGVGNAYHVFPTMQTERHEIEVEGSHDGQEWQVYEFKYKPGVLNREPRFIVPHQPRLDWMIWFVPTRQPEVSLWFDSFMRRLWQGEKTVLDLLAHNPFAEKPPRYLRALVYRYHFTDWQERERTGNWWKRELMGEFPYVPPRSP